jgi:hypothetical protein
VFENRLLKRIFAPKTDNMTGGKRKLHNVELYNLYSSPRSIKIIKSGACNMHGGMINAYIFFVAKYEGKSPLERPRYGWEDYIIMDLMETGRRDVDWILRIETSGGLL